MTLHRWLRALLLWLLPATLWLVTALLPASAAAAPQLVLHDGPCNASAALGLGQGLFAVVDDEAAAPVPLRIYRIGQAGPPLAVASLPAAADANQQGSKTGAEEHAELDLEGAAWLEQTDGQGRLAYWIGSHSTGRNGASRPSRRLLFATRLQLTPGGTSVEVEPVGLPYRTLIEDLNRDPRYAPFRLERAAAQDGKGKQGLSIEGLGAGAEGSLLIGFRNPLIEGKALVASLRNPAEVLAGATARFGDPQLLDLGGLGIRSLEATPHGVLVVAGAPGSQPKKPLVPRLFHWSGAAAHPPREVEGVELDDLNPEALFQEGDRLVILSDDGHRRLGGGKGKSCEDLPSAEQGFRGLVLPIPAPAS
ncbi:MAG: DUF3616 domain-containing protein [Cyanobacteriota bacterium]|jgi:hypothetical protein